MILFFLLEAIQPIQFFVVGYSDLRCGPFLLHHLTHRRFILHQSLYRLHQRLLPCHPDEFDMKSSLAFQSSLAGLPTVGSVQL